MVAAISFSGEMTYALGSGQLPSPPFEAMYSRATEDLIVEEV